MDLPHITAAVPLPPSLWILNIPDSCPRSRPVLLSCRPAARLIPANTRQICKLVSVIWQDQTCKERTLRRRKGNLTYWSQFTFFQFVSGNDKSCVVVGQSGCSVSCDWWSRPRDWRLAEWVECEEPSLLQPLPPPGQQDRSTAGRRVRCQVATHSCHTPHWSTSIHTPFPFSTQSLQPFLMENMYM